MRADARANRERILAAAEQVFGERGAQASTEEVAARAGVGIATVFRHFPAKRDLLEATLVRHFEELTGRAVALTADAGADAGAALRELVTTMIETGVTKVALAGLLTDSGELPATVALASGELASAVEAVLRHAQEAGSVREDVSVVELYFLVRGLAQAAAVMPVPEDTLRRVVMIVFAGLEPARGMRS